MLNIYILCVGELKEKYFKDMALEYIKRLQKYCKLEIIQIKDEKIQNMSTDTAVKEKESNLLISKLNSIQRPYVFVLDEHGTQYSSVELAKKMQALPTNYSNIVFIIGGSLGLSNTLKSIGENISFSRLTFPHQLIRVFLLEQIYRCFKISNNENYHH